MGSVLTRKTKTGPRKKSETALAREAKIQATFSAARRIDEALNHPFVYVGPARAGGSDGRKTNAERDREANYMRIKVDLDLPAADTERIKKLVRALADALAAHGVPYHPEGPGFDPVGEYDV